MIIKQLTEIKTTVNSKSTLFTCNNNSRDKTIQNSSNVIDKTIQNVIDKIIQNKNKELFLKKNASKNLANTNTLNTTDNFTSTYFGASCKRKEFKHKQKKTWRLA